MNDLVRELEEIKSLSSEYIRAHPRATLAEIAEVIQRDEAAIRTVMQAMYADGEVRPLYVYEMVE